MALPLAMAVMKTRKGTPLAPEVMDDLMRDIRGKMGMLLRGNAPPKEPDPNIIRQLTGLGQRASAAPGAVDLPITPGMHEYQRGVSAPLIQGKYETDRPLTKLRIRSERDPWQLDEMVGTHPLMEMRSQAWKPQDMSWKEFENLLTLWASRKTWP